MRNEKLYRRVVDWEQIPEEEVRLGVRRRGYASDEVMLMMNVVDAEMEQRPHSHEGFDQLVYIVEGSCNYHVDGVAHEMGPGSMMLVPAGAEHHIEPLQAPCQNLDIFVPPRSDYARSLAWIEQLGGEE
ncbi:MAG: cupin domain-containing protein [Solirubrobacteraceae bacterium]